MRFKKHTQVITIIKVNSKFAQEKLDTQHIYNKRVKLSLYHAMEAHRVVRR
jgi:hypothetical protein